MSTKIEWTHKAGYTGETWNPVTGCTKVSEGCRHCYAERMAKRLAGRCGYPADEPFRVTLHPERLDEPLRWRKPRMVFVCSMSDLFHEDVPEDFIVSVFARMLAFPEHIFQVLTKRPKRMHDFVNRRTALTGWNNIWLGVTAENQRAADERHEYLRECPAAVRFVSYEPALGPVDWSGWEFVNQIISGGESGPQARPSHPDWHRATRDFCQANSIAYFFKQWGAYKEIQWDKRERDDVLVSPYRGVIDKLPDPFESDLARNEFKRVAAMQRVGKKAAGRILDGRTWEEFPAAVARLEALA